MLTGIRLGSAVIVGIDLTESTLEGACQESRKNGQYQVLSSSLIYTVVILLQIRS